MTEVLSKNELYEILHDPIVKDNVQEMYEIGHVRCHESGFAVYGGEAGRQVSGLVMPRYLDAAGSSIDNYLLQVASTAVDLMPLTRKHKTYDSLTSDEIRDMDMGKLSKLYEEDAEAKEQELSDKAALAIERINADQNLEQHEKLDLIESVEAKDRKRLNGPRGENIREDILMVAHNHPRVPFAGHHSLDDLTAPSPADLMHHDYIRTVNPSLVHMVVASSGVVHQALLFRAIETGQTNPGLYDAQNTRSMSLGRRLGLLASAGYAVTAFALNSKGAPARGVKAKLADFERQATVVNN